MSNHRTRQGNLMVSLTEDAHAYNREFFTLEITHMDGDEGIENDADVSGLSVFATQAQIDLYLAAAMAHATARCGQEGRVRNAAVYAAQAGVLAVGTCTTSKVGGDGKMSNYTAGQNHEPLEHEMAEYVELEVTLRSKTTFGTDKETIRVWDGQSAKDVAERTAQGYGAEVVEIRNPDGSIYEEALKVEDSHSPGM